MTKDPHIRNWKFNKWQEPSILLSLLLFCLSIIFTSIFPGWITTTLLFLTFILCVMILYFFRDPDREVIDSQGLVVGPCDGKVVSIDRLREDRYLDNEVIRISIFLSLFDVHVQRSPLAGKITLVDLQPGKFLQAFRPEASDVNEYIAMRIETPYGKLLVKQIAGILARRCINFATIGDQIRTGERFGHIKFGSRVDLYLPLNAELKVNIGDKVRGGLTSIAQLSFHDNE
jgi:phosphatidylserine decarboxylase